MLTELEGFVSAQKFFFFGERSSCTVTIRKIFLNRSSFSISQENVL